ncbi:MAG: protein kinase domain-containing protein, partial [Limisphaerales bacterium]
MNSTAEQRTCPNCGAAIPANAPQGVCPKCLMAAAAVSTDAGPTGGKRPEPPSLERLAAAFPQLDVIEFIGQGGMGAVYKARQKQLDRIVALKVLPPGIGDDPAFAERFTREAKALAKLMHPNIVALFEFGQADGIYYLLMEFVDGVSLGQLLRASRVSAREALAIVPQICDALQYAHDQGIVHRDIKPENILLDRRGRVKVADFGLAKLVESNAPLTPSLSPSVGERVAARPGEGKTPALTDAGKVMGTPAYMAPEQVEHPAEVDHRADIYALGVVFYQMLTGELPGKRIEAPSKKVQIDVRLDEVVLRALEKKPELRYQQVSEVKTMVETIVGDAGVPPAEPGVASGLFRPEAEKFARDVRATLTPKGLLLLAKKSLLWLAEQCLLLLDVFATTPSFVERAGRRRFNFWPFVLLSCSNLGFMVNGVILAISLVGRQWDGRSLALSAQERVMFQWMVAFAVGRLAALNMGANEAAGAGRAQVRGITAWRVVRVLLTLLGLAAWVFGLALLSNWLNTLHSTTVTNIAQGAPSVAIVIAVGLALAVGWAFLWVISRTYVHVRRTIREKTEESANADGLPAVAAWLAIIDGGNYTRSWETAAPSFQGAVSKEEWVGRLEKVRRPLGKVLSRKLGPPQFKAAWTRFGASFNFATSFDGLPAATETVTFARQAPNGEWKAIGYLITPAGAGTDKSELHCQQVSDVKTMVESISSSSSPVTGTAPSPARLAATRGRLRAALIAGVLVWLFVTGTVTLITWIRPESWKVVAVISCPWKSQPGRPVEAHFKFIATMIELIRSDVILGRVIDRLELDERSGKLDERWGKRNLGLKLTKAQAMVLLRRRLDVRSSEGGTLIQVGVFGKRPEEPEEAMDIANTIAEELRAFRIEQHDSPADMLEMTLRFTPPYFLLGSAAAFVLGLL